MTPNRKHFQQELSDLNYKVYQMGYEVLKGYKKLLEAVKLKSNEISQEIINDDPLINELEISINVDAYLLIAKQCPVAGDLRQIITALKISNDLERIADYTVNISKYLKRTKKHYPEFLDSLTQLIEIFTPMLEGSMKAFLEHDMDLALEINKLDDTLDDRYRMEVTNFMKFAKSHTDEDIERAMSAVLALKQLERAGDHVTNICENIIYFVSGKRVELN